MAPFIHSEADLDAALRELTALDPRFSALLELAGRPPLRRRAAGFAGLAAIVVSQQLSVASASAVWKRLTTALVPFNDAAVRGARRSTLQRAGLSTAKIRTLKAVASAIHKRRIDLQALAEVDAEQAHAALVELHGVGPWTADIYLLSCLGHADVWPAGDLALREAARLAFSLPVRPTAAQMGPLAEAWRPWRAVAARLLWTYYRAVKRRDGAPIQPGA
jgi:DNA-3-methyladenine glycosylase II